jgi:hypothetical protein
VNNVVFREIFPEPQPVQPILQLEIMNNRNPFILNNYSDPFVDENNEDEQNDG